MSLEFALHEHTMIVIVFSAHLHYIDDVITFEL